MKQIARPNPSVEKIQEDLKQNWTQNSYARTWGDQFGFTIHYGSTVTLYHKGEKIVTLNTLNAAKEISRVYLNDMIFVKRDTPVRS